MVALMPKGRSVSIYVAVQEPEEGSDCQEKRSMIEVLASCWGNPDGWMKDMRRKFLLRLDSIPVYDKPVRVLYGSPERTNHLDEIDGDFPAWECCLVTVSGTKYISSCTPPLANRDSVFMPVEEFKTQVLRALGDHSLWADNGIYTDLTGIPMEEWIKAESYISRNQLIYISSDGMEFTFQRSIDGHVVPDCLRA